MSEEIKKPLKNINNSLIHIKEILLNKNLDIYNQELISEILRDLNNNNQYMLMFYQDYLIINKFLDIIYDYKLTDIEEINNTYEELKNNMNINKRDEYFNYDNIINIISIYFYKKYNDSLLNNNIHILHINVDKYNLDEYMGKEDIKYKNIFQYIYNNLTKWTFEQIDIDNIFQEDIQKELDIIIKQKEKENKQNNSLNIINNLINNDNLQNNNNNLNYVDFSKELKIFYKIIKFYNKLNKQILNISKFHYDIIMKLDKIERKIKNDINNIKKDFYYNY